MSATLTVTQESALNPAGVLRGTFDVMLDGKNIGSIEWHESIEASVEPGHHTLQVSKGKYTSAVKAFDATDGESVIFHCNRRRHPLVLLAELVNPGIAISLVRK